MNNKIDSVILPQQAKLLLKKNWEYYQKINKENQKKRKTLQENKYITYDIKTKKFIPIKKLDKIANSTAEESSLNSRTDKNNITVRKINSKIKLNEGRINSSSSKNNKKKEEKNQNLNSSILNILKYNSKNLINLTQKEKNNDKLNNISYDINERCNSTNTFTRNKKLIRLNTLPSLFFSNLNILEKKSEKKIKPDSYSKKVKKESPSEMINNKVLKGNLVLSSSNFFPYKQLKNNKTNIKLLEDISFDLSQTYFKNTHFNQRKHNNNNNKYCTLWRNYNNFSNSNIMSFSNEFKDKNSSINISKKNKRKETKASTCYTNTNTSNTNDGFFIDNKGNNKFCSVEEIHIAFVELIKNQNNLLNNQESIKCKNNINEINNSENNDNNSISVIYVEEQDL